MGKVVATRQPPRITTSTLVSALPPANRYVLRGAPEVMKTAGDALDLTITEVACQAATLGTGDPTLVTGALAALWLGPDERLILASPMADIPAELEPALREWPHSLVDVSHRQTALQVAGPMAATLLNAGCPLDLDLSAFPVGMCTRTVLAKAEIVLWRTEADAFHVEVWRSFASYVSGFLAEVSRELPVV